MWILIAVVIEGMAFVGALSILTTRRTLVAFVAEFNTMALVTGVYMWYYGFNPWTVLVTAMVAIYLVRMNWALFAWSGQTALNKYVSFAVVGNSIWGWIAPLLNLLQYAFDAIPKSEKWAADRNAPRWEAYKVKTRAFVPYLI